MASKATQDIEVGIRLRTDEKGTVRAMALTRTELNRLRRELDTSRKSTNLNNRELDTSRKSTNLNNRELERWSRNLLDVRRIMAVLTTGTMALFVRRQIDSAAAIKDAANIAGLYVEELQEMRFAFAELNGVATDLTDNALQRFNRRLGLAAHNAGPAITAYRQFNIALHDANGNLRATGDVLDETIARLAAIEDPATRAAYASAFFGDDAGPKLAAALGQGIDAMETARQKAHALGLVLSKDQVDAASRASRELHLLFQVLRTNVQSGILQGLTGEMGSMAEVLADPQFRDGLRDIGHFFGSSVRFLVDNAEVIARTARALAMIGAGAYVGRTFGGGRGAIVGAGVGAGAATLLELMASANEIQDSLVQGTHNAGRGFDSILGAGLGDQDLAKRMADHLKGVQLEIDLLTKTLPVAEEETYRFALGVGQLDVAIAELGDTTGGSLSQWQNFNAALRQRAGLQAAADLIKQTATDEEKMIAATRELNRLKPYLVDLLGDEAAAQERINRALREYDADARRAADAANRFGMTFASALEDAIVQGENFRGILRGLLDDIKRLIVRIMITERLAKGVSLGANRLFGLDGARADGGPVRAGGRYLVGERGPEIFVPDASGIIVPNHALGGGSVQITQSIDARGADPGTEQRLRQAMEISKRETIAAIQRWQANRGRARF